MHFALVKLLEDGVGTAEFAFFGFMVL